MSEHTAPQRESVYFSRRLAGWGGGLLFGLSVGLSLISLLGSFGGSQGTLLLLIAGYALFGTVGWRAILIRRAPQPIFRYFMGQFALITMLMTLELASRVKGLSTSILGIGLMMQATVLPGRMRLWLFGGLLLLIAILYTQSMSAGFLDTRQIPSYLLLFIPAYAIGLFLGLLIVGEERASETSRRLDESNRKLAEYAVVVGNLSTIQERNRLARELHDNLGHYLTALNMQLEVALLALSNSQESAQDALLKAQALTKEALSEVRRSISAMRATPLEDRLLPEAIASLAEEHRASGIAVNYRLIGNMRPCSGAVDMTLYRIAQEGLTNIRKHAQATQIDIVLDYSEPGSVSLLVGDNGVGSDHSDGGFGLLGIRERVQLLGGSLAVETAKGQGFVLRAVVPGQHDLGHKES